MNLKTEAEDKAEVEVALGRSRPDSRNSIKLESFRRIGCWATRLTNLSRAKRLLAMNSFSVVRSMIGAGILSSYAEAPADDADVVSKLDVDVIFTFVVPMRLFSGAGGMIRPFGPCFSESFS